MVTKKKQKLALLVYGPKHGETTEQKPVNGKITVLDAGFQGKTHLYKMSTIFDNEGNNIAVFQEPK